MSRCQDYNQPFSSHSKTDNFFPGLDNLYSYSRTRHWPALPIARDYSAAGKAAAGVRNAWISSVVARAERPTPISVAEANPVQLP